MSRLEGKALPEYRSTRPRKTEAQRGPLPPINLTDCPMYTKHFVNPCPDRATALLNGFSQVLLLRNPLCCLLAILLTAPNLVGGALFVALAGLLANALALLPQPLSGLLPMAALIAPFVVACWLMHVGDSAFTQLSLRRINRRVDRQVSS